MTVNGKCLGSLVSDSISLTTQGACCVLRSQHQRQNLTRWDVVPIGIPLLENSFPIKSSIGEKRRKASQSRPCLDLLKVDSKVSLLFRSIFPYVCNILK